MSKRTLASMAHRRLKAAKIFDGEKLTEGQLLILQQDGTVEGIVPDDGSGSETMEGILCPGFINSHCHLELSHMKSKVPPGGGMVQFLIDIVHARRRTDEGKMEAIRMAENELREAGVNGVADICNTPDTIEVKKQSSLRWYNLIEVINFYDSSLEKQLSGFVAVQEEFENAGMPAALCAHAPYSISAATYAAINERTAGKIISIHNQESKAENDLFISGDSDFLRLYREFTDGRSPFPVTGKSSLQTWLPYFTNGQTILIVHNTFISEEDIGIAKMHAGKHGLHLVFCLCPNANLSIEGKLPPVELLLENNCTVVLGTDSYSSNYQLSIAEEIKTLRKHFPFLTIDTLLKWATSNGADALRWSDLGRFKKGARPGVILLDEKSLAVTRIA